MNLRTRPGTGGMTGSICLSNRSCIQIDVNRCDWIKTEEPIVLKNQIGLTYKKIYN